MSNVNMNSKKKDKVTDDAMVTHDVIVEIKQLEKKRKQEVTPLKTTCSASNGSAVTCTKLVYEKGGLAIDEKRRKKAIKK